MKLMMLTTCAALIAAGPISAQIAAPVLKWQHGGCYASWCETGWYSSPAVADIDGDGAPEVIASAYSVVVLDGASGALEWRVASGHDITDPGASNVGRTWPGIVVADVDADGADEIVTAHSGGWVSVYDGDGHFEPGWPRQPASNELRGLSVGDLDDDGTLEILVTAASYSSINAWVLEHDGTTRSGWPQLTGGGGYSYGVFNDTSAIADLDGDGSPDLLIPSDVHYICAYSADGQHLAADPVFGGDNWGEVGVWESYATELQGWGACNGIRAESYRTNFANGPASVADMDGDGTLEVVATGRTYDCTGGETTKYNGVYVFEPDRGRFTGSGYDWTTVPIDLGAPLSLDWNIIENAAPNPALGDLDGDGEKEIVYADFSGRVHAFWLDGSEHGLWPLAIHTGGPYRFASEPAIVDLDNDGSAEVLVTTWVQKGTGQTGELLIVSATGMVLHRVDLPAPFGSPTWNGSMPCPTVADVDGDPDLEVVLQTAHSGVVVYDLPGSSGAEILWGTGRGSMLRNGTALPGDTIFADGFEDGSTGAWD